ncbi:hypothetical protein [Serpentinicella alkaliphila]|uniref:N-acetyltransferase domain-containing protein n=2 Tax=Serpentinicella alkaliphila TaxID=1734049 RepID=A0A4R2T467_9FIRM|nr:hypothetical protein [Serpentinicella alkaliphila]TCP96795.1 hypothetical protein EDD79_104912 [Serpentinicella alkaliphila]
MITIRRLEGKDYDILEKYIKTNGLDKYSGFKDNFIYIAVIEDRSILGISEIEIAGIKTAQINLIFINQENRKEGLGDGLFRSTLYYLLTNGYENVLIQSCKEIEHFLFKRSQGLTEFNVNELVGKSSKKIYLCNISILLESKCRV